jgi:hypothetical protein
MELVEIVATFSGSTCLAPKNAGNLASQPIDVLGIRFKERGRIMFIMEKEAHG